MKHSIIVAYALLGHVEIISFFHVSAWIGFHCGLYISLPCLSC